MPNDASVAGTWSNTLQMTTLPDKRFGVLLNGTLLVEVPAEELDTFPVRHPREYQYLMHSSYMAGFEGAPLVVAPQTVAKTLYDLGAAARAEHDEWCEREKRRQRVRHDSAVARIGDREFNSLSEAVAAANPGESILLLSPV